jgi:ADP-ribose pyrophosphatase YjhB (NUDIX family)
VEVGAQVAGADPDRVRGVRPLTSVGWVHMRDGKLLVVRTRGRELFYLPGGKPEAAETHEHALVREIREELGLALRDVRPAFTVQAPAHGLDRATQLTMHCFYASADSMPAPTENRIRLARSRS